MIRTVNSLLQELQKLSETDKDKTLILTPDIADLMIDRVRIWPDHIELELIEWDGK